MSVVTPNIPVVNEGMLYINGLSLTFLTTTTFRVATGQCRNSSDLNDINLTSAATVNVRTNGLNGLDTGTFAVSSLYSVYVIADSTQYRTTGALISLSATQPLLPFGYDMYRRIGTIRSDATAAPGTLILPFTQKGSGSDREMWYADPIATPIAAGNATAFAIVNLTTALLCPVSVGDVMFLAALTSDAGATRTATLKPTATTPVTATNGTVMMSSPASVVTTTTMKCPATVAAGVVSCDYLVSDGAAALALSVHGYVDQL